MFIEHIVRNHDGRSSAALLGTSTGLKVDSEDVAPSHHSQALRREDLERVTAVVDRWHDSKCSFRPLNRFWTFEDVALGEGSFIWREVERIKLRELLCDRSLPGFHVNNRMSR